MNSHNTKKLFIGGAGKSGTTFLFSCLGQHPSIISSKPKEPSFFLDQDHPLLNTKNNIHQKGNHGLFFSKESGIQLDGTPHLLYQKEMPTVLAEMRSSKVIFILRHPVERIYSSFQFVKHNLAHFKKDISFSEYVAALLEGNTDLIQSWLRTKGSQYVLAKELEISTYYKHIARWEKAIGKEHLCLLTFKNLIENTEIVAKNIFQWLDLEGYILTLDQAIDKNTSYQVRSSWLHYQTAKWVKLLPKSKYSKTLKQFYFQYFQKSRSNVKREENISAFQELSVYFEPYNNELAAMTDLEIEHWS